MEDKSANRKQLEALWFRSVILTKMLDDPMMQPHYPLIRTEIARLELEQAQEVAAIARITQRERLGWEKFLLQFDEEEGIERAWE